MRVLSWDIGIYNLSFCDIEYFEVENNNDKSKKKKNNDKIDQEVPDSVNPISNTEVPDSGTKLSVKLHDWGIVPLIKKYCDECGAVAMFRKGDDFLCTKHWKTIEETEIKDKFVRIGKEKCCGKTKANKPCSRKPNLLYLDEYFCSTHLDDDKKEDAIPLTNQTKDLNFLGKRIFEMCKHFAEIKYDAVLFENQPSLKNPTMKSVQIILYTFFHHSFYQKDWKVDLQFISASNKLKVYEGDAFNIKANNKYTENKKLGILHTSYFIQKVEEPDKNKDWPLYLAKHSKKDDLCDSFLQALYFFKVIKKKTILIDKEIKLT